MGPRMAAHFMAGCDGLRYLWHVFNGEHVRLSTEDVREAFDKYHATNKAAYAEISKNVAELQAMLERRISSVPKGTDTQLSHHEAE